MQSSSPPPPAQPSNLACDLCEWLNSQKPPLTLLSLGKHKSGELLLPAFGIRHVRRLSLLLDQPTAALQRLLSYADEIFKHHLPYLLLKKKEPALPGKSLFANRDGYEYPPLACFMLMKLQDYIRLINCPLPVAREHKLHRIPKHLNSPISMDDFLSELHKKFTRAKLLMFSWFGETTAPEEARRLRPEAWMEILIYLLRYEAWPGTSICEAIFLWGRKSGANSDQATLVTLWLQISPLFQILYKEEKTKLKYHQDAASDYLLSRPELDLRNAQEIGFARPQDMKIAPNDTLQAFFIEQSKPILFTSYHNALGNPKQIDVHQFRKDFLSKFEPFLANENVRPYLLHAMQRIADEYDQFRKKPHDLHTVLKTCLSILKNMFLTVTNKDDVVEKSLTAETAGPFFVSLSALLFVHAVHLDTSLFSLHPIWFDELLHLWQAAHPTSVDRFDEVIELTNLCARWTIADKAELARSNPPASDEHSEEQEDPTLIYARTTTTDKARCQLIAGILLEACGFRQADAQVSLKNHFWFLRELESKSLAKLAQPLGYFLLTKLPLREAAIPVLKAFIKWQARLRQSVKSDELHLSQHLVKQIEECTADYYNHLFPRTLPQEFDAVSMRFVSEVNTLLTYSMLPAKISWRYARFLILALKRPNDGESARRWNWANLHNGALSPIGSSPWSIRCHASWLDDEGKGKVGLRLSVFLLRSVACPVTQCIEVILPLAKAQAAHHDQIASWAELLCDEHRPLEASDNQIPVEIFNVSLELKKQIRAAILREIVPLIQYNEIERCYTITPGQSLYKPPLMALQVRMIDCHAVFTDVLSQAQHNPSIERLRCCTIHVWSDSFLYSNMAVDCLYKHQVHSCMGEGEDEVKDVDKDFFIVTLRLSDHPEIAYQVTYVAPPTPLLLGWQLALLKELVLRTQPKLQ